MDNIKETTNSKPTSEKNLEVSITIPTYNERDGIEDQISCIFKSLDKAGIKGEVVIVDDNSPDRTWEFCEQLKSKYNLMVIRRPGKLGLASAVIDGFKASNGDIKGVMDADGSHDAAILPDMIRAIQAGECDLAIGSRYIPGGGTKDWPWTRIFISKFAIMLGRPLTSVRDITSGFCLFKKEVTEGIKLDPIGWKIVLEIIIKGNHKKWKEFPYMFRDREKGESKIGKGAVIDYLKHLIKLWKYMGENDIKRV
ncbi:MAG: polyprenol monophosphomannose synthase [Candidatus Eremiobacteraeota bacterium]|nr:polyprenol monophosphomannose synthase [Candidatus Eremiobacteraeota bacterium]